ncbi:MAG: glycosyltransferase family 4 protein [Candidatus Bathyarchaeota archaeon]|nr:MAG: glycosyltransferase family 4 protein [Candidatus Bathyarchaeota archaeon]
MYEVTPRLQALGHEVKIYAKTMNKRTCFKELLHLPVEIFPIKSSSMGLKFKKTFSRDIDYYWAHARTEMRISRHIAEWHPDAVVFHYTGELWLPPYFYYLQKPVGVLCLHVVPRGIKPFPVKTIKRKIGQKLVRIPPIGLWRRSSYKKFRLIITHSLFMQNQIQGTTSPEFATAGREIVPLGVDHSKFHPTGEEEPFFLYLGRVHPQKSVELVIEAMKDVKSDYTLVIAGDIENQFSWYKDKLLNLAKQLQIMDRLEVIASPTRSEVIRLIQRCSVFLFPSTVDTFGLAALEAMACGKPIVACKAGGIPELLGDCGVLLDPEPRQWALTLRQLASNPRLRHQMGKRALKRSKHYSWEQTCESLINALGKLPS